MLRHCCSHGAFCSKPFFAPEKLHIYLSVNLAELESVDVQELLTTNVT